MPKLMTPLSIVSDGYIRDLVTEEWLYASILFKAHILQNNYMTANEKSVNIVESNNALQVFTPIMQINHNMKATIICRT
jgi:hypothetical protein